MMCEVGCASKIKKELLEQDAVSSVIIDFVKERETDFAIVEFDPKGNTIEYIYGVVNAIADGKLYTVKSVETTYYKENTRVRNTTYIAFTLVFGGPRRICGKDDRVWNGLSGLA